MALLVPSDYPIAQICTYNWNSPPYVPAIPLPPQVDRARTAIAAAVANEAGAKATQSSARMYCYNLFATNNWNNQAFAETVKLVADYLALQTMKGLVQNLEAAVGEATSNLLTLSVSSLIYMTPELKSMLHPSALTAAMQNVPQLENLKKEILQMYHNNGMGGMHPGMQMMHGGMTPYQGGVPMQGGVMYAPGGYPQQQQMQHAAPAPHNGHSGFSNGGVTTGFMEGSFDESDRFASRRAAQSNGEPVQHHQPVQPQSQPQYHTNQPYHVTTPQQTTAVEVTSTKPTELTIPEGTEMDRAKHQLSYFGGIVNQDLTPRMELFQKKSEELSVANVDNDGPLKAEWRAVLSLDEAIALGRVNYQKQITAKGTQELSREFIVVATPIIVGSDMKQYWDAIRSATSFVGMAKKMQSISIALEESKTPENMSQISDILNLLSTIDVNLTKIVNKFLNINLGMPKVSIDTFVGDVESLSAYLHKKFGPMEAQAFAEFENEIYDVLVHDFDEETTKSLLEFLNTDAAEDYPLFPENFSVTYLFLNSKELGYQVTDQPVRINARSFPSLHQVATSLEAHKKAMEMSTVSDLLVCSDGVKYRIFRDYRIQGEYLISAA